MTRIREEEDCHSEIFVNLLRSLSNRQKLSDWLEIIFMTVETTPTHICYMLQ